MSEKSIISKYKQLSNLLKMYAEKYYNEDAPMVDDAEYDNLYKELIAIEKEYPELISATSITQNIGGVASGKFKKIEHLSPMLSLQNAYSMKDIHDFYKRSISTLEDKIKINISKNELPLYAEPKIDGLSCSLTYKNGKLQKAATRGNGNTGEDVTKNILTINEIPISLDTNTPPDLIEIRGEIYMQKSDFDELNNSRKINGEDFFANPRNAAAGSLRQLDHLVTKSRKLKFFAYAIETEDIKFTTQEEISQKIQKWGFKTNPLNTLIKNIDELENFYNHLENIRAKLPYDIDGAVYKINNINWQNSLGTASKYPKYAIAHKFAAETAITYIRDIFLSIGRTGILTPVAIMEPVNVGGVVISKSTLHNKNELTKKDIRIGDKVLIQRAGDVIPQIISSFKESRKENSQPFDFPKTCPYCGSLLAYDQTFIKCVNHFLCKPQIIEKLSHFCSRDALNIEGFAIKNIEFFVDKGIIKTPIDIFKIQEKIDIKHLATLDGWGYTSVKNLLTSIEKSKTTDLAKFIFALGINQIGKITAKILAEKFTTFENFLEISTNKFASSKLSSIDGIGPIVSLEIISFFENQNNKEIAIELNSILKIQNNKIIKTQNNNFFSNKSILITGTLKGMTRLEAQEKLESLGAKILNSFSKKLDILIVGENPGSKLQKANELNIMTMNEEELLKNMNNQ